MRSDLDPDTDVDTDVDGYVLAECRGDVYRWRERVDDTEPTRLAWREVLNILRDAEQRRRRKKESEA